MPRFELVELDDIKDQLNEGELAEFEMYEESWRYPEILWDNREKEIVWAGCPEPEDATLSRDFRGLVSLLNEVNEEKDG